MITALLSEARRFAAFWQRMNARIRSSALFYNLWRRTYERPFREQVPPSDAPAISVVTWADGSPDRTLQRMTNALSTQNYPRWRWIIIRKRPDCGDNETSALNRAVAASLDPFVLILNVGDTLASFTLTVLANALVQNPHADVLLFDEDTRGHWSFGLRHSPRFKVANAPEALRVMDTWQHAVLIRRSAWQASGGLNESLAATDARWELYRRLAERSSVMRVPMIGYTRHPTEQDTPALTLSVRRWQITSPPRISIIIPTRDNVAILRACLDSILDVCSYPDFEVIIVETGSTDPLTEPYYETLTADPRVRLLRDLRQPFNYAAVNNYAVQYATGDAFLFLNDDTQALHADWLDRIVEWLSIPQVAIVGARLSFPESYTGYPSTRRIQHAGVILGSGHSGLGGHLFAYQPDTKPDNHSNTACCFGNADQVRNLLAVTGACMLVRRATFEALGGFDTEYQLVYSDIDLCIRAVERGQRVVYTPDARLLHHEGLTHHGYLPRADFARAAIQWRHWLREGDPYYHPALSYAGSVPMLRLPNEPTPYERIMHLLEIMPDSEILSSAQLLVLGIRLQLWSMFR